MTKYVKFGTLFMYHSVNIFFRKETANLYKKRNNLPTINKLFQDEKKRLTKQKKKNMKKILIVKANQLTHFFSMHFSDRFSMTLFCTIMK